MWAIYALGAAVCWGLSYTLSGKLLQHIAPHALNSMLWTILIPFGWVAVYLSGRTPWAAMTTSLTGILLVDAAAVFGGAWCAAMAMSAKHAAITSMIEISFPVFIALFSFMLFGTTISLQTIVGAVVVFVGAGIIVAAN